jgi:sugar/nucleoside kinase (ribokinase family)
MAGFSLAGKVDVPQIYLTWGGGAANTAVALAKLGINTSVIGCVGKDENGRQALANLRAARVDVKLVKIDNKLQTGLSIIVNRSNADKEHVAFVYRGANDSLVFARNKSFKGSKYFYLNSLNGDNWLQILKDILAARGVIRWGFIGSWRAAAGGRPN